MVNWRIYAQILCMFFLSGKSAFADLLPYGIFHYFFNPSLSWEISSWPYPLGRKWIKILKSKKVFLLWKLLTEVLYPFYCLLSLFSLFSQFFQYFPYFPYFPNIPHFLSFWTFPILGTYHLLWFALYPSYFQFSPLNIIFPIFPFFPIFPIFPVLQIFPNFPFFLHGHTGPCKSIRDSTKLQKAIQV